MRAIYRRLDSMMKQGDVLIVEPYLRVQAEYLRAHGFRPRGRPQTSPVTGDVFQWWYRATEPTKWSARRDGLVPITPGFT